MTPPRGLFGRTADTLSSMVTLLGERQVALVSAGVAFYALLAIFPGVAAVVALWGLLSDPAMIEAQVGLMREFVPDDAYDLLVAQVDRMVDNHQGGLGFTTAVSLLVTLWSSRLGVGALIQGVNAAHGVPDRGGVWHNLIAIALTVSLMGVALVALAAVVILPVVLAFFPLGGLALFAVRLANWLVVLAVVLGAVALVYRYGPNRKPRLPWLTPGLWLSVGVWASASVGFSFYLANFGNYSAVYGSLGAVIALLMWFYISAFAVLLGAALNSVLEGDDPAGDSAATQVSADPAPA
ncbi:YihY/virulence factor BrkB family protein [Rhodobaculum claviforme]|uniref:Uncharacterized protein n=1 Tax=Rhodobaculum claviforme TaxID=1549854 RepID=A0A934TLX6_9RHOB|nr:YihY/virulence factor BrkB family protein [Rhodobaculum claviforme]MBK5928282.1 hypothetical protein [Rhodobaculum claviforme]